MATRNRSGRNLVSASPSASAIAQARWHAVEAARAAGLGTREMIDRITRCCSIQQIEILRKGHKF